MVAGCGLGSVFLMTWVCKAVSPGPQVKWFWSQIRLGLNICPCRRAKMGFSAFKLLESFTEEMDSKRN